MKRIYPKNVYIRKLNFAYKNIDLKCWKSFDNEKKTIATHYSK